MSLDEAFADMRRITVLDDLCEFIRQNGALFYRNGGKGRVIPDDPTWDFDKLDIRMVRQTDDRYCLKLTFSIVGNDPHQTLHRMFDDTGLVVKTVKTGWHDFTALVDLSSSEWPGLFVRRKLESLDDVG